MKKWFSILLLVLLAGCSNDEKPEEQKNVEEALKVETVAEVEPYTKAVEAINREGNQSAVTIEETKAGIGVAYGRALVIKAGFSGSGIKDLIYMGDVVNKASKMCGLAYKEYTSHPICVTEEVYVSAGTYIANAEKQETF